MATIVTVSVAPSSAFLSALYKEGVRGRAKKKRSDTYGSNVTISRGYTKKDNDKVGSSASQSG